MPAQRMEAPITVAEAILAIQKRDYLLPAIQREFVWSADKTVALFDSLMRGYPVGSFLFWRVHENHSQTYKFFEFMQYFDAQDNKRLKPAFDQSTVPRESAQPRARASRNTAGPEYSSALRVSAFVHHCVAQ